MKFATILFSMLFAGAAFANPPAATTAPAHETKTEMADASHAEAPAKKEHKKKGKKEDKKHEGQTH